jgi:cobalt-zinc-cadmium efflux system membrane fusion protein
MKVEAMAVRTGVGATRNRWFGYVGAGCLASGLVLSGCKHEVSNPAAEGPAASTVVNQDPNQIHVEDASKFPLAYVSAKSVVSQLQVTGSVSPDVSKELPVLSLANGRVVALHVELGDYVRKGQLVMDVQSPDIANAFSTYEQAVSTEHLSKVTLDRDNLLIGQGAIPQSQVDAAKSGEEVAQAALKASEEQLKIYGVDKNHPSDTVHVYSPTNGVVVAQNVTSSGAAGVTYAGAMGSLTIADLSHVWVLVDVYENELAQVHMGQHVDIHISAYPKQVFDGTISDIGASLDPSLRTGKVRIVVKNPGNELRIGMFATGSILGSSAMQTATVPGTSILHLHDTTFVFVPTGEKGTFRRVQIQAGQTLPDGAVEVMSGLSAGQQVVAQALDLQNTADNQ